MKILLVAVNAKYIHSNLAIYTLQAYARKMGQSVEIGEYTINQPFEVVLREIYDQHASVLCFSCYIWNIEYVKELAAEFHKLKPEVPIWFGGPEVSFRTKEFLEQNPAVTGIVIGEGEKTFAKLCQLYQQGQTDNLINEMDGIAWRNKDGEILEHPKTELFSMDEIPFCYQEIEKFENRIIYYESGRGCPFSCSYCLSSVDKHLRMRSLELVYPELQFFLDHKVPQVKFVDRTFNCSHKHAIGIWNYILEHDNGITNFHFEVSADLINEEELQLLKKMRQGLVQLEIGVQSTNQNTITEIHRTMNLERLKYVVKKIAEGKNINQHLDLIAGLPYEGYDSFQKSFDEIYRLKIDQLQLGFLKVLKGSYMYDMAEKYELIYRDKPPYEVLATKWLSYEEVEKIKMVEDMLEIYYNSRQFLRTLAVLETVFESPFEMYLELAEFYKEKGLENLNFTRIARANYLYQFALQQDAEHKKLYEETLIFDLYVREKSKARPEWAVDLSKYHRETNQMLRTLQLEKKYCHIEPFTYAVFEIDPGKMLQSAKEVPYLGENNWMLFDYENRNQLNREARIRQIEN